MPTETPAVDLLDLTAKTLAVGATACLLGSVVYDWGFFSALGLSFLEVPSSINDHIRSALVWAPATLGIAIAFAIELALRRSEGGMSETELLQGSPNPERTRRMRQRPYVFAASTAGLAVLGYVTLGSVFLHSIRFAIPFLWVVFAVWAHSHARILARTSSAMRTALTFGPALAILMYFSGYEDAVRRYEEVPSKTKLFVSNPGQPPESVVLLRHLEKGILVKDATNTISFRPWAEVKLIQTPALYSPYRGVVCTWFNVGCLKKP